MRAPKTARSVSKVQRSSSCYCSGSDSARGGWHVGRGLVSQLSFIALTKHECGSAPTMVPPCAHSRPGQMRLAALRLHALRPVPLQALWCCLRLQRPHTQLHALTYVCAGEQCSGRSGKGCMRGQAQRAGGAGCLCGHQADVCKHGACRPSLSSNCEHGFHACPPAPVASVYASVCQRVPAEVVLLTRARV